jgi:hypothetical protein
LPVLVGSLSIDQHEAAPSLLLPCESEPSVTVATTLLNGFRAIFRYVNMFKLYFNSILWGHLHVSGK